MVSLLMLAVSFLLCLLVSWALLLPFFSQKEVSGESKGERVDLLLRKNGLLDALEDLEQDFRAGKVSSSDYQLSRAELILQAGEVIESLEKTSAAS